MPTKNEALERVYAARTPDEIRDAYQGWAGGYDAENLAGGFRLPSMAAAYVARHVPVEASPLLDAGCGTGLVGEALSVLGYRGLVGLDISEAMLDAAGRLGVYSRLARQDLGQKIPEPDGAFAAFSCVGSFGPGHAPPESLDELVRVTRPGGVGIFNVVEASYEAQGFAAKMAELEAAGRWRERERSPAHRAYLLAEPELLVRIFVFEIL